MPPPLLIYPFPLPIILPRRYRRPALYSANPLSTRLCFIRFMSLLGGGWADMNLIKHNLVQRGLAEYKAGLLSLLGRMMRRKVYTSRGGATVTTMGSEDYIKQKLVARLPRS